MDFLAKPLRVLIVSHTADLLGAEQSLLILLKHISREKFEPFVVLPREGPFTDELKKLEIEFEIIPFLWWIDGRKRSWELFQNFLEERKVAVFLSRKIREKNIDIVYTNTIVTTIGALAARKCRVPHVWHIREILKRHPYLRSFLGPTLPFALVPFFSKYVIVNSEAVKSYFPRIFHNRVIVAYNAFDPELLEVTSDVGIRGELNLSDQTKLIVSVGKIAEAKGQIYLVQAFKEIKDKFPQVKLILVGQGENRYFEKVTETIHLLGLKNDVYLTGFRRDAFQIMKSADILIIPSIVEPFGRVALEAMHASKAVIASRTGGLPEIVDNGETGILVKPGSVKELSEAMSLLLSDSKKAEMMGHRAYESVQQKFSIGKYVSMIEEILERSIQESSPLGRTN